MQSITLTFTAAATGKPPKPGFCIFWMMVLAIAILDDDKRREKERRREQERAAKPTLPGLR